jgi:O-antigen/teichoic acid export membrane protein
MEIRTSKKDVLWSYIAQFFTIGTGLLTLPAILKILNADEVGFNYILISITSMIGLFDLGFTSQFSRYLTYIFSGAQSIQKEGIANNYGNSINAHLLSVTIRTAKRIYKIISFVALLCLLVLGTPYIWKVTEGFTVINNALAIWIIFSISSFFNIYYLYLNAFLQGKGLIKEAKQAMVFSKILQITITFTLLFLNCGLMSVVIANLISPFLYRLYAYKHFYDAYIKKILNEENVTESEIKETFSILFYNAKKIGVIAIMASLLGYASTLVIGAFLPLPIVGSYGIMVQLVGIVGNVANTYNTSKLPQYSNMLVTGQKEGLRREFGLAMCIFYVIYSLGIICLFIAPIIFKIFNFSVQLPSLSILAFYSITRLFEQNQSAYCQLLVVENRLVYYRSAIITCLAEFLLLYVLLYFGYGVIGVVVAQAIPLFLYCAWKWPIYVLKRYNISFYNDIICASKHIIFKSEK